MGWFQRIFGGEPDDTPREPVVSGGGSNRFRRGWESAFDGPGEKTTRVFLEELGRALGVEDLAVVSRAQDCESDLRGTLRGFPLKVSVDWSGGVHDLVFKCADDRAKLPYIDLEYDPKAQPSDVAPFEPSDRQVFLGPGVWVEGSDAEKAAAAFHKLPADLQARIVTMMAAQNVLYFRSRSFEFDVTLRGNLREWPRDPVGRLHEILSLAAEMHTLRGAKPPIVKPKESSEDPHAVASELARRIAVRVSGAKVVEREADHCVDVRWIEDEIPTRIAIDYTFKDVDVEARASGVAGELSLHYDADVTVEKTSTGDAWDAIDHYVFFAKSLFVTGREAGARAEASLLQSIGPELVDELVRTCTEVETGIDLEDELVTAPVADLMAVTDDGATAIRFARLLARVAKALPRGAVEAKATAVRCAYCSALWFPSPTNATCSHCGARA